MRHSWIFALPLVFTLGSGCDFPRDSNETWQRVLSEGILRIGAVERPPWVRLHGAEPSGFEPRLLAAWAAEIGATIHWTTGSESALMDALRSRRLDVVAGGFTSGTVWTEHAAPTQPYFHSSIVIAVPPGAREPQRKSDLRDATIAHPPGRPDIAAKIAELGARPAAQADEAGPGGRIAAIDAFRADALGLTPTPIVLAEEPHVLLVAKGESRLLFELDRFLARRARTMLAAGASP